MNIPIDTIENFAAFVASRYLFTEESNFKPKDALREHATTMEAIKSAPQQVSRLSAWGKKTPRLMYDFLISMQREMTRADIVCWEVAYANTSFDMAIKTGLAETPLLETDLPAGVEYHTFSANLYPNERESEYGLPSDFAMFGYWAFPIDLCARRIPGWEEFEGEKGVILMLDMHPSGEPPHLEATSRMPLDQHGPHFRLLSITLVGEPIVHRMVNYVAGKRFINQKVIEQSKVTFDRMTRKDHKRKWDTEPNVHYVRLRALEDDPSLTPAENAARQKRHIEHAFHWMVSGHMRRAPRSAPDAPKTILVQPYVKGDIKKPPKERKPRVIHVDR